MFFSSTNWSRAFRLIFSNAVRILLRYRWHTVYDIRYIINLSNQPFLVLYHTKIRFVRVDNLILGSLFPSISQCNRRFRLYWNFSTMSLQRNKINTRGIKLHALSHANLELHPWLICLENLPDTFPASTTEFEIDHFLSCREGRRIGLLDF